MESQKPEIRPLQLGDIEAAVALGESVGWGDRRIHWGHLLNWAGPGALGLFVNGDLVSAGCAICYPQGLAWLGCIATQRDQQRKGYGTRLCEALVGFAQARGIQRIMLDAGESGRPLYEHLGFRAFSGLERWQGEGRPHSGEGTVPFEYRDLAGVVHLDARQFGVCREWMMRDLVQDPAVRSWVIRREGEVQAFIALKAWIHGGPAHIGPWQAWRPQDARSLLRTALGSWAGCQLYLDIPAANSAAKDIAAGCGLQLDGTATRMILGAVDPLNAGECQFGIAMRATG
jgi:GNAT superfamily N-acetyltransferase